MLDIAGIFQYRTLNAPRLLACGFTRTDGGYAGVRTILGGQFVMHVAISDTGKVSVKTLDADSREEYVLIHAPAASGAFVGSVIQACEAELRAVAEQGFDYRVFQSEQTLQIVEYVGAAYRDQPEFLWKKFPRDAVFRRKDMRKWYAVILTVERGKLGVSGSGTVEILDLRALPDSIGQAVDGERFFAGYHMNKKHWYTICLNGSVDTKEICERIDESYRLAK